MSFLDDPVSVRLTHQAGLDLIGIFKYSGETWGEAQQLAYRRKVEDAFQAISRNPGVGRFGPDGDAYRMFRVSAHLIIYRVATHSVDVLRVLHHRMHFADHLANQ